MKKEQESARIVAQIQSAMTPPRGKAKALYSAGLTMVKVKLRPADLERL